MFTLGRTLISQNKHQINASDRVLLGLPFGTPLGFALAITLVHLGAHFDFVIPVTFSSIVQKSPSVIFCSAAEAQSLYDALLQEGASTKSRLRALSSRVPVLREGRLPKPNFSGHILSQKSAPRAIVVFATSASDVLSQRTLDHLRAFLAIPVLQGFTHPLQPVPLALSHMHDFQLVHSNAAALVGPPSSNVEIKLTGMSDGQSIMCGNLQCRGPAVICNNKDNKSSEYEWWNADMQVHILPNGVLALQ